MTEIAGLDFRSTATTRSAKGGKQGEDQSGFAALLATLGAIPQEPQPEKVALPGGKTRQAEVLEALETALAGLANPAGEGDELSAGGAADLAAETPGPAATRERANAENPIAWYAPDPDAPQVQPEVKTAGSALLETSESPELEDDVTAIDADPAAPLLANGAVAPASAPPDSKLRPGQVMTDAAARDEVDLPAMAARLDSTLRTFDATYGTDTRGVIARNAAALPPQAFGGPIETPQQFVGVARTLLGLAPEAVNMDSRVAAFEAAKSTVSGTSVAELIGRAAAAALDDRSAIQSLIPTDRIGSTELAPLRPADAPAQPPQAAQPQAQTQPQTTSFAANLAAQVKGVQLVEGTTRVELAPRGLGGLEISVAKDDDGGLQVTIRAENPSVLNALRDGRDALLAVLRDAGATVQDAALGFEGFGRDNREAPQEQATAEAVAANEEEEPAIEIVPVATTLPEGRVDIIT